MEELDQVRSELRRNPSGNFLGIAFRKINSNSILNHTILVVSYLKRMDSVSAWQKLSIRIGEQFQQMVRAKGKKP